MSDNYVKFYKTNEKEFNKARQENRINSNGVYFILDKGEIWVGNVKMCQSGITVFNYCNNREKEFKVLYDSGL